MGNQESVPANPGLIKKKKIKQKQKPVYKKTTNNMLTIGHYSSSPDTKGSDVITASVFDFSSTLTFKS